MNSLEHIFKARKLSAYAREPNGKVGKFCWKTKRTHTARAEPFGLQFCYENNPVFSYRKKKHPESIWLYSDMPQRILGL